MSVVSCSSQIKKENDKLSSILHSSFFFTKTCSFQMLSYKMETKLLSRMRKNKTTTFPKAINDFNTQKKTEPWGERTGGRKHSVYFV